MNAIRVEEVTHVYSENSIFEKKALDEISFEVNKGEMVAIIGHTGSGKSTLIQHLNGLLKPTAGKVFINGDDIHSSKEVLKNTRHKVGLIFQYPEHQLFEATVLDDVCFGPLKMGKSKEDAEESAKTALETVGLDESVYKKSPFELSGGQKRRASIAGVLAMKPEVLILDEPTAGLDPRGREDILGKIKEMHQTLGITVILVSHSMDDAARLCEKIMVMNNGKIVRHGTSGEIFSEVEYLTSIGLDVPQIAKLMAAVNNMNSNISANIYTMEHALSMFHELAKKGGVIK